MLQTSKWKKKYNLVAHAKTHKDFFRDNYEFEAKAHQNVQEIRLEFIQHCTELIAVNSEPFELLGKSGFLKMNKAKLQILKDAGCNSGLGGPGYTAVKNQIEYLAGEIVGEIRSEVEGKFVSLMVDGASKHQLSVLGMYIQYMVDSRFVIRSIGTVNITSRHTGQHLANVVAERLNIMGIKTSQLIAVTTDNASNMSTMIERLNDGFDQSVVPNDSDEREATVEIQEIESNLSEFQFSEGKNYDDILRDAVKEMELEELCNDDSFEESEDEQTIDSILQRIHEIINSETLNIHSIRCAAHTLQLALMKALSADEFKTIISLCRGVCKQLRKKLNIIELEQNGIRFKMPHLDVKTRWNSIYIMVCCIHFSIYSRYIGSNVVYLYVQCSLILFLLINVFFSRIYSKLMDLISYCKDAITYFAKKKNSNVCFELFLYKLPVIGEIVEALKIPFEVTVLSQNVSFTLSDFYGCWLKIARRLEKMAANPNQKTDFAKTLLSKIEERKSSLLNNEAMLCAVYLDKRFDFKLSADEKTIAKHALEKLFERVKAAKKLILPPDSVAEKDIAEDSFEEECIAAGLGRTFSDESENTITNASSDNFTYFLEKYEKIDRQHHKTDILEFWNERRDLHPEIYELASIIHSIPPTQSTVERSFSILGYILDSRRTKLSPSRVEDIMMINLNRESFDPINRRDLERL